MDLIIRPCRHILPCGRRPLQPAVSGRVCCRHHLDAQARLHNMARARHRSLLLRLRVPETSGDLNWNQAEVCRLLATERIDPDTALMMLKVLDFSATVLHDGTGRHPCRCRNRANNLNGIYDVATEPFFSVSLSKTPTYVAENTSGWREGVAYPR